MPETLETRSLERRNIKRLSLLAVSEADEAPKLGILSAKDTREDELDVLEVIVEFKHDLMPEDFNLGDLTTLKELPGGTPGGLSVVRHKPSGVVLAKRTIEISSGEHSTRREIQRELSMMRDCSATYLVECFGTFLSNNYAVICMEYMDVGSMADIIRAHGPIQIDVLGKVAVAILSAITYLYSNFKIMHRNLKPSKVLLNSLGQIKLSDFRASGELLNSLAETVVGSGFCYMAPERIQGDKYTIKSETWSFGLTIMELAIGKFPYDFEAEPDDEGESVNIMHVLQTIVYEPVPKLPRDDAFPTILHQLLEACMQKDPKGRPSPSDLYKNNSFTQAGKRTPVDLTAWIASLNRHES